MDLGDEVANLAALALHSRLHTRDTTPAHNGEQQGVMFTRRLRHAREPGNVSNGNWHRSLRVCGEFFSCKFVISLSLSLSLSRARALGVVFNSSGALRAPPSRAPDTRQKLAHGGAVSCSTSFMAGRGMSMAARRPTVVLLVVVGIRRVERPLADPGCHSVVLASSTQNVQSSALGGLTLPRLL